MKPWSTRVADEAVLRLQIQDVVLVDPGRDHQKRPLIDLLGGRRILDQLHQLGLEDHLAGREGDVPAELEGVEIGHLDRQPAAAAAEIVEQVVQPAQQVLAARFQGRAQHLGIGGDEVAGRHGVDELARIEVDLLPGLLVRAFQLVDRIDQPARGQEIRLLDEVEHRIVAPGRVAKAAIAALGLDHRRHVAGRAAAGRSPARAAGSPARATAGPAPWRPDWS